MTAVAEQRAIGYEPQRMQLVFHTAPADEILYGGAAGGGKSEALINGLITTCALVPRTPTIVFRRTNSELQQLRDRASLILSPLNIASWNHENDRWTFTNGSYLRFSHLEKLSDVSKHLSSEYCIEAFDEATTFLPKMIEALRARNRSAEPGAWARIWYGTNPGNVGHVYFKNRFVEPRDDFGTLIEDAELIAYYDFERDEWVRFPEGHRGKPEAYVVWRPDITDVMVEENKKRALDGVPPLMQRSRVFIPAFLADNKYLYDDPSYNANLASMEENERKRFLYGSWDLFEGQYFEAFRTLHHVIQPIDVPPHWRKWRSIDWGFAKPTCVLWHTQDPETKQVITYRELYGAKMSDEDTCRLILAMSQDEHVDFTVADPAMWRADANPGALSRADIFERYGVKLLRATNDRMAGWSRIRDLLGIRPETGKPGWVITRDCVNLIRTLPELVYDPDKPEDLDTDGEDHAADAARYGLMAASTMRAQHGRLESRTRFGVR